MEPFDVVTIALAACHHGRFHALECGDHKALTIHFLSDGVAGSNDRLPCKLLRTSLNRCYLEIGVLFVTGSATVRDSRILKYDELRSACSPTVSCDNQQLVW
jgi:hypothetical protein